jgi:periplasmic protein TonB
VREICCFHEKQKSRRDAEGAEQLEPSRVRGVYQDMFEQSVLLDAGAGKRTGAVAVSLTAQSLGISLLLLIPLVSKVPLISVQRYVPLAAPHLTPPPPEPGNAATSSTAAPARTTTAARPFHAPHHVPAMILESASIDAEPPAAASGFDSTRMSLGVPSTVAPVLHVDAPVVAHAQTPRALEKPIPVGGDVQAAKLIRKVVPGYPALARQARVSGIVRLVGIVATDGTVRNLQLISGHALLTQAALDAVKQWIYQPTLLNGQPVEVIAPIDVIFTLSQ